MTAGVRSRCSGRGAGNSRGGIGHLGYVAILGLSTSIGPVYARLIHIPIANQNGHCWGLREGLSSEILILFLCSLTGVFGGVWCDWMEIDPRFSP